MATTRSPFDVFAEYEIDEDTVTIDLEPEIDVDLSWLDDDDDGEYTVLMATVWRGDAWADSLGNIALTGDQSWLIGRHDLSQLQRDAKHSDAAAHVLDALDLPRGEA